MLYSPKGKEAIYGSYGFAFTITRILQAVCLICVLGMSANFIAEINSVDTKPPPILVATLSIVVIVIIGLLVGYLMYLENSLNFLVATGSDSVVLITLIVIAVKIGTPISYLDCPALPDVGVTSAFVASVFQNSSNINATYFFWAGASKTACYELKSIWGFSMALCVLFFFSGIINMCIWQKEKKLVAPKDIESY